MGKKIANDFGFEPDEPVVTENGQDLGFVEDEPVKKKSAPTSADSSVSFEPVEQPSTPSEQPTEKEQPTKVRNPYVTLKRKGEEVLLYQIPASLVSAGAAGLGQVESTFKYPAEQIKGTGALPVDYREKAVNEIEQINSRVSQGFAKLIKASNEGTLREEDKTTLLNFMDQANQRITFLNKNFDPGYTHDKINEWQKNLISWSIDRSQKGAKISKNLVNRIGEIGDPIDAINWAVGAVAESGVQIPAALLTFGTSSVGQEIGSIYMDSILKIAEKKGITPQEVIEQGLDSPAAALTYGTAAGLMDFVGAKGVVKGVGQADFTKSLRTRALQYLKEAGKGGFTESGTELSQTILEQYGAGLSTGDTKLNYAELGEATARAFVGGSAVRTVSQAIAPKTKEKVISDEVKNLNPTDPDAVKQAAQNVQQNIEKDATALQQDQATVPQGREVGEGGQADRGSDVQQGQVGEPGATPTQTIEQTQGQETQPQPDQGLQIEKYTWEKSQEEQAEKIHNEFGNIGLTYANNSIDELIEKKLDFLRRPDNRPPYVKQSTIDSINADIQRLNDIKQQGYSSLWYWANNIKTPTPELQVTRTETGEESGKITFGKQAAVDQQKETPLVSEGGVVQQIDGGVGTDRTQEIIPEPQQTKLGARFEASEEPTPIKEGVKGRDQYIPRQVIKTDEEAKKILSDWNDQEFAERAIRDTSNEMPGGTRGALAANLYQQYKQQAEASTTAEEKQQFYNKAADIGVWAAQNLTKQGQETSIAGKIWKSITSNEDILTIAMEKSRQRQIIQTIDPIRPQVQQARQQFTEEIERVIRERVTAGVESQLGKAKLITTEKRKQIADAFDKLKIKGTEGTLQATTLVPEIWNGAVEAVKRAVLAGADVANAVQAGIDYIRQHHKGDFDENDFKSKVSPAVEQMTRPQINPSKVDEKKISTPKLKGQKKKNFISEVVEEYNQKGGISDERFEQLYAKQLGAKEFSPQERQKIRELAKIISDTEKFKEEVKNNFTVDNIKKYKGLFDRAQKANEDLQEFAQNIPATIWDTLSTILQGNLLAPISIMRNIYSNLVYQPLRFISTLTGSVVDRGLTELAKTGLLGQAYSDLIGKNRSISLVGLNKGYFKGGWNGFMEGLMQLKTGQQADERTLREINTKFNPIRAIQRWADKDRTLKQKINDYVEGTLGLPAEGMFRLLNLGDKPFRRAAETAKAFELAEIKGLKGEEALKFVMFPDDESAQQIDAAGKQATFQDESKTAKMIQQVVTSMLNHLPGPLKVLGKTQIPFVRTPVNILAETLDYALPIVTFARGMYAIKDGNKRQGSVLIGKAITGLMIHQVANYLLEAGLMTWGGGDDEKGKRAERASIQYDTENPNSLNVEALSRGLSGQGFKPKDGDTWVDYKNLGVLGMLLQVRANTWYRNKKEGVVSAPGLAGMLEDINMDGLKTVSSAFDQSFLQGTSLLLKALEDPEGYNGQKWLLNTTEALSSIVIPRTVTTVSQASDEYIRDTRDKDTLEALQNVFKKNLFQGDKLAARVNLWGEKITGNPEGRNRLAYYLFDVTRFKEVDTDSFKYRLYKKWKEDNFNDDWLPSLPDRTISVKGVKVPLTNEEYAQLATEVGQARARKLGAYMSTRKDDRLKVDDVKEKYSDGYNQGRTRFMMNTGWNMKSKKWLEQLAKERDK